MLNANFKTERSLHFFDKCIKIFYGFWCILYEFFYLDADFWNERTKQENQYNDKYNIHNAHDDIYR